ncbi:hypothetical protein N0V83_007482 [Neocucurbitaria cava]|uniref:Uncharacterized protein n=1 Tax=Neocucurbitaria cava TaxID=798079 RepID=A0A9W9CKB8_9PLEO|nr:hypothetical protein N0V83_007482 [Neocucurbitaria cava]
MSPMPIIVCGRNPNIAKNVRKGLLPEYDVIHVAIGLDAAISDIPLLFSGKTVPSNNNSDNLGSQNYAKKPVAVAVGGGFDDEMFEQMKAATEGKEVVWVRPDLSKMDGMPELGDVEAYAAASAVLI